jgi:DNA-directed RNA polymerase
LEAINLVQSVPFRINGWILDVLQEAVAAGNNLGGLIPQLDPVPLPEKMADDIWEKMEPVDRAAHKHRLSMIHSENAKREGRLDSFLRKIALSRRFRELESLYFPHFFDFRYRMYPMPGDLHPQADDIGRGLLMFSKGVPLGSTGEYWLAVRMATCAGQDKLPFDDRVKWTFDHTDEIIQAAKDPLGSPWWHSSDFDEPLNALATCRELAMAWEMPNGEEFVSHLPIPQDGSINGCQHLSLLGRDPIGAFATNCTSHPERQDLYMEVAEAAKREISTDAVAGVEEAHQWVGKVTRSTVKRATMTTPYGVTDRGIMTQLIEDGHVPDEWDNQTAAATYLQQKISQALGSKIERGKEIMAYFQTVAAKLAEHDVPLQWTIPTGSICVQSYWKMAATKVSTLVGRVVLMDEEPRMGLNKRKCALASAPNIIHSLDGAMLAETVRRLARDEGVTDVWMIHDSYGCHAAHVNTMRSVLRQVAYDQYSGNWLADFHQEVLSYAPEGCDLPLPPEQGDFDISEVLRSTFFFS